MQRQVWMPAVMAMFASACGGRLRGVLSILMLTGLVAIGCSPEFTGEARFTASISDALSSSSITRVSITSSGEGMVPISIDLAKTDGRWEGIISNIPAGTNRSFLAQAFDSTGSKLFEGTSSGATINPNEVVLVVISLQEVSPPPPFFNEAPIVDSVIVSPTTVTAGGSILLRVTAHDPNSGDTLSYSWSSSGGSFSNATSGSTTWNAPATVGLVPIVLAVSDSKGAVSKMDLTVNVVSGSSVGGASLDISFNRRPVVSALSASAARLDVGQSTTVSATASDGDGDSLSFQWEATCAGTWTNPTSRIASFSPSTLPATGCNNCQLSVTASDGRGAQTTGTLAICVASSSPTRFPPTLVRAYQSASTVVPLQDVNFEVSASDPHGSALSFSWNTNGGTLSTATNGASHSQVVWKAPSCASLFTPPSVTATVTNAYGRSTSKVFYIRGIPQCLPVQNCERYSVTSYRGLNGTRISCTCGAVSGGGSVWGTDLYTDDSVVCRAAVHAGRIPATGGNVVVVIQPGQSSYTGSTRNGITTSAYTSWVGSYSFE